MILWALPHRSSWLCPCPLTRWSRTARCAWQRQQGAIDLHTKCMKTGDKVPTVSEQVLPILEKLKQTKWTGQQTRTSFKIMHFWLEKGEDRTLHTRIRKRYVSANFTRGDRYDAITTWKSSLAVKFRQCADSSLEKHWWCERHWTCWPFYQWCKQKRAENGLVKKVIAVKFTKTKSTNSQRSL